MAYVAVLGERERSAPTVRRRHAVKVRMQFGVLTLAAATVVLACVLSILYFLQVNRLTMAGYSISELEKSVKVLKEDNKQLSYEISQHKALTLVSNEATSRLQMVPAEEIQFWWKDESRELLARQ